MLFSKPVKQVAILIPYYKTDLTEQECYSVQRCITILNKHPIYLLVPDSVTVDDRFLSDNVHVIRCDDHLLSSVRSYDEMLRESYFYFNFRRYKYLLIYQLDAIVFSDELFKWCEKEYDYIGPSLYEVNQSIIDYIESNYLPVLSKVFPGKRNNLVNKYLINGGISLRKVRSFLLILLFAQKRARLWGKNEDLFWSLIPQLYWRAFHVPSKRECNSFAFMLDALESYRTNSSRLPFAGHGWFTYSAEDWQIIFDENNMNLNA